MNIRRSESSSVPSTSVSRSASPLSMNQTIRVFVLQAKLDDSEIAELYSLIESQRGVVGLHLQLCGNISDADIILSNVHMRKRLERHLDWNIARQKAIVTPDWLRDSIAQQRPLPCAEYAALGQLKDETAKNCPECDLSVCQCSLTESKGSSLWSTGVANQVNTSLEVMSNYAARYACLRASPLVCPNQSLAAELGVLRMHRDLEGKSVNALSYERAIAVIKAYPHKITHQNFDNEVVHLPHLGQKICSKIKEFIRTGTIGECETIRASERFQSLKKFTTIHNVGATTARHLYNIGLRTIEDIERYYEVPAADDGGPTLITDGAAINPLSGKRIPTSEGLGAPDFDIKAALTLRHELADSVPRAEVEEIRDFVISELEELQPGCVSTIVGGYRRGKPQSNDVDIVITHPNLRSGSDQVKSFRKRAVQRLYERGLVTHVAQQVGFHSEDSSSGNFFMTALTVFILPTKSGRKRVHRRVDLIFAASEAYWSTILGWTGSKMFERDLRLWAKAEKGIKFDSSAITRRHDSKMFYPKSEQDIFSLLGLEWIDPTMRNADI